MLYVLINMIFASSLANTLSWVLLMLTIAFVSSSEGENLKEKQFDESVSLSKVES